MKLTHHRLLNTTTALALIVLSNSASAHHPMDGETPATLWQGLLSGFGHPILGLDHLAFIIAVGLLSALVRLKSPLFPMALVSSTVLGAGLMWSDVTLPFIEVFVAMSVLTAGILLYRIPNRIRLFILPASIAALYHGLAYGEAIVGAESTPLGAYLVGLSLIQMAIAGLVFLASRKTLQQLPTAFSVTRYLSATAVSGIGLLALFTALSV